MANNIDPTAAMLNGHVAHTHEYPDDRFASQSYRKRDNGLRVQGGEGWGARADTQAPWGNGQPWEKKN